LRRAIVLACLAGSAFAAEEQGEGHGSTQVYWKWANFAVLAGAIGYVLAKNAGPFFLRRTESIRKEIREAGERKAAADARFAEIEARLAGLAADVEELRAESRREMQAEAHRAKEDNARAIAKIGAAAEQEIGALAVQAQRKLRAHAAAAAMKLAEAKLRARVGAPQDAALVADFTTQLSARAR
jgi:F-type H+-transporting ATPase subunit b